MMPSNERIAREKLALNPSPLEYSPYGSLATISKSVFMNFDVEIVT